MFCTPVGSREGCELTIEDCWGGKGSWGYWSIGSVGEELVRYLPKACWGVMGWCQNCLNFLMEQNYGLSEIGGLKLQFSKKKFGIE